MDNKLLRLINIFFKAFKPKNYKKIIDEPQKAFLHLISPFLDKKKFYSDYSKIDLHNNFESYATIVNQFSDKKSNKIYSLEEFLNIEFINKFRNDEKLKELRDFFNNYGSNKNDMNLEKIYQPLLEIIKIGKTNIKLFEIGLGTNNLDVLSNMGVFAKPGASLRAFSAYLPKESEIYGADVDKRILFEENNIKTFFLDQLDLEVIKSSTKNLNSFDLIIDDGLHTFEANINVIKGLLDKLSVGGFMVIEDIEKNSLHKNIWNSLSNIVLGEYKTFLVDVGNDYCFIINK